MAFGALIQMKKVIFYNISSLITSLPLLAIWIITLINLFFHYERRFLFAIVLVSCFFVLHIIIFIFFLKCTAFAIVTDDKIIQFSLGKREISYDEVIGVSFEKRPVFFFRPLLYEHAVISSADTRIVVPRDLFEKYIMPHLHQN